MKIIVLDSESDGLWEDATKIHVQNSLKYDPESGKVSWKICSGCRKKVDEEAGCIVKGRKYVSLTINGKQRLLPSSRIAWFLHYGRLPINVVDHINGDPSDNRITNLRDIPQKLNMRNQNKRVDNTSGYKGVCFRKNVGKWDAQIVVDGKSKHLGRFLSAEEASEAYDLASKELHGDYGKRNQDLCE